MIAHRILNRHLMLVFSKSELSGKRTLTISSDEVQFNVKVSKYMSHLKDEIIIEMYNLSQDYRELLKTFDVVTVKAGRENYKFIQDENHQIKEVSEWINHTIAIQTILIPGSHDKSDLASLKTIIVCSSRFRSKNLKPITISGNLSIEYVLKYLTKRAGIRAKISPDLKVKRLQKPLTVTHISNAITQLMRDYPFIQVRNDTQDDADIYFDYVNNRQERKNIVISPQNGTLIKDWINIDGNGDITFTSLPNRVSFRIGDNISVNSKYLNVYYTSAEAYKDKNRIEYRLDKTIGKDEKDNTTTYEYIIISLEYVLDVRGTWEVKVKARPRTSFNQKYTKGSAV